MSETDSSPGLESTKQYLQSLMKKDDDVQVIEVDHYSGDLILETHIKDEDIPQTDGEYSFAVEEIEENGGHSTLLQQEREGRMMDVYVQIVQILFLVNAMLVFMCLTLGIVPYEICLLLPFDVVLYVFAAVSSLCVLFYLCMIIFQRKAFILVWGLFLCFSLSTLTSLLDEVGPFQVLAATFLQSCAIVAYTALSRRDINAWVAVVVMIFVGLGTWTLGMYAFVEEQDWISAIVVLAAILAFACYAALQIGWVHRYSLSDAHLEQAIVHFYGDLLMVVGLAARSCCGKAVKGKRDGNFIGEIEMEDIKIEKEGGEI